MARIGRWVSMGLWLGLAAAANADPETDLRGQIDADLEWFNTADRTQSETAASALEAKLGSRIDGRALATRAFGSYVSRSLADYTRLLPAAGVQRLVEQGESELGMACREHLVQDLRRYRKLGLRDLRLTDIKVSGTTAFTTFAATMDSGPAVVLVEWAQTPAGWLLTDAEVGGKRVSLGLRQLAAEAVNREHSLPVVIARLRGTPYIVLEDFAASNPGDPPSGWSPWRGQDQAKPRHYIVRETAGKHYLEARDEGSSVILGKVLRWDPREYPILTWCWRAHELPVGADERLSETNDSAGGVYVVFSLNWLLGAPKQLKYVWSTSLPVGTVDRRNLLFRPWFFVVESGDERLGKWTFEQVDLVKDYQLKLGEKPADRTVSLQLLTDANSTHSRAAADYADLRVWPRDAVGRGEVRDYCGCLDDGANRP
jgi:hypothetical protein